VSQLKSQQRKSLSIWDKKDLKKLDNVSELQDVVFLSIQKASELNVDFSFFPSLQELWIDSKQDYQIPDSFLKLEQLDKFILGKNCFLPENIHLLKSLRELWLKENGVLNPPKNICKSQSIRELHILGGLDFSPFSTPEWIFEMIQIEKIRFSVCQFTSISEKINRLENLIELDFGCSLSDLVSFPDLSGLTKLKRLEVTGESVQGQKLPPYSLFPQVLEGIKTLTNIECLALGYWRPKKKSEWLVVEDKRYSIPNIFDRYPNLTELYLNDMKLDFVPASVLELKNLKCLNILSNNIDSDEVKKIIQHLPDCRIDSDIVHYKPKKK
jgi:Leucine-rich repeat (LRR) protein